MTPHKHSKRSTQAQLFKIFLHFLQLGCYSFGGPAAHIGYFRVTFVERLKWLDDAAYARLIALSQFLPGPGSSQVGFALGYRQAGILGGLMAFVGFTLPSILIMLGFALAGEQLPATLADGLWSGLKLLAVLVVADAVLGMYRSFCQSRLHQALMVIVTALMVSFPTLSSQLLVLLGAALIGALLGRGQSADLPTSGESAWSRESRWALGIFLLLLLLSPWLGIAGLFYQAGSFVFGGGHVVLPMLQTILADQLTANQFLQGYSLAQAVPGPMFTLATYLGAVAGNGSLLLGVVATLAVFAPGLLLVVVLYDRWEELATRPVVASSVAAINASVVGLLLAALYQPIWVSSVLNPQAFAVLVVGWWLMSALKWPIPWLVLLFAVVGISGVLG